MSRRWRSWRWRCAKKPMTTAVAQTAHTIWKTTCRSMSLSFRVQTAILAGTALKARNGSILVIKQVVVERARDDFRALASISRSRGNLVVEEAPELPRPARVLELAERLGLNLADALARHRELLADLFERVVGVHADAEAHAQNPLFARGERSQNTRRRLAQVRLDRRIDRQDRVLVLDEVAEVAIILVADWRFEADRLLGDLEHLAHLLERHRELLGKLLRRRLAADLVQHLARGAHDLVDRLNHVHRNADRARLIGDRAGDRLPDPPCGVGRELVAAAVFELVHRLHEPDVPLLDEIEELKAAVRVLLGDRDDEPEVRLDHFLLRLPGLALSLLDHLDEFAELLDLKAGLLRERLDFGADFLDRVLVLRDELLPAAGRQLRDAQEPLRIELRILVVLEEVLAADAMRFAHSHEPDVEVDEALVDVVELLDQRVDAVLVQGQRLDVGDDLLLEDFVLALLRRRERLASQLVLDILVLQPAQLLVGVGDAVESLEHLRLEFGLHGRQGNGVFEVVLFVENVRRRRAVKTVRRGLRGRRRSHAVAHRIGRRRRPRRGVVHLRRFFAVGAGVGCFKIDDIAEEDLPFVELVAPDDDGLKRERALAEARDHRLPAGLDALGDGDLAFTRQKLDRAHFAQVHPHGIVGALRRLRAADRNRRRTARLDDLAALAAALVVVFGTFLFRLLGVLAFDDVDAHFAEHCVHIFNLVGRDLLGRQDCIEFVLGHPAPLLGDFQHPLDGGVGQVEEGAVYGFNGRRFAFALDFVFLRHCGLRHPRPHRGPIFRPKRRRRASRQNLSATVGRFQPRPALQNHDAKSFKRALTLPLASSDGRRGSARLLSKALYGRFRMRELGQLRLNVEQSREIPLVWLKRQRPLREFQLPI